MPQDSTLLAEFEPDAKWIDKSLMLRTLGEQFVTTGQAEFLGGTIGLLTSTAILILSGTE